MSRSTDVCSRGPNTNRSHTASGRGTHFIDFVRVDDDEDKRRNGIWRILDILFGNPYKT